jgi:maleylpyruvate isomerase
MSFTNAGSQVQSTTAAAVPAPREQSAAVQLASGYLVAIDRATEQLYEVVADLDPITVRGASLLPGWSRGHLITHLARNADALVNLLTWAKTGVEHPAYASKADRDADIEEGSTRPLQLLRADLDAACQRFAAASRDLPGSAWEAEIANVQGKPMLAHQVPWLRLREVWFHLVDLDRGVGFADLPDEWVEAFVDSVAGQFADHPDVPALVLEVELPHGRQRSWELNTGGTGTAETVSGAAADMIGWLTGRQAGSRLGGNVPKLPAWL